jgi:hypothetical protein
MYRDAPDSPHTASQDAKPPRVRLPSRAKWNRMDPTERVEIAELSEGLIDPRVAKHGGYRTDPKAHYEFPGMQDRGSWRGTPVHQATAWYGCNRCGLRFADPHAFYRHSAVVHDL